MSQQDEELEKIVQALCWKLYLEPDSQELKEVWESFEKSHNNQITKIVENLARVCQDVLKFKFQLINSNDSQFSHIEEIELMWNRWLTFLVEHKRSLPQEKGEEFERFINTELKQVVREVVQKVLSAKEPTLLLDDLQKNKSNTNQTDSQQKKPEPRVIEPEPVSGHIAVPPEISKPKDAEENPQSPIAQWKYIPIPDDELEPHDESYSQSDRSPEGLKLIGARVRGKMHKHNGTNCDDWFEFAVSGSWTIIAVSDGAGSKKFSRIGAKIACRTVVKNLSESLKFIKLRERNSIAELQDDLKRNEYWEFAGKEIEDVQQKLHEAIQSAHQAVVNKVNECKEQTDYFTSLNKGRQVEEGKKPEIKDFSSTLLVAVHTTGKVAENEYSLVLTCQVGDGALAAISEEGTLSLLNQPDTGQFAGQTEFLTSKNKIEKANLLNKTFVFAGRLKALMVMTDGVADDYFPSDPGMLQLYGDLVLNHIINISQPNDAEIDEELRKTELVSRGRVREIEEKFQIPEQIMTANGNEEVKISYLSDYAKELGFSIQKVVDSPALLWVGANAVEIDEEYQNKSTEEKLETWLDFYYRKGSFDDRTLVMLYREEEK